MPNNSPTIVSAALSDKELQTSINNMVSNFEKGLQTMLEASNDYVGKIQTKLQEIGKTKFDSGSSDDKGASKRAESHKKLAKAVNESKDALAKEEQGLVSLKNNLQSVQEQENALSQSKQKAANDVANYNAQLKKQETELAQLKSQQQSLADAEQKGVQSTQQQNTAISEQQAKVAALKQKQEELNIALQRTKSTYNELERVRDNARSEANARRIAAGRYVMPELGERQLFSALVQYYKELGGTRKQLDADMKDGRMYIGEVRFLEILAQKLKTTTEEAKNFILGLQESKSQLKMFSGIRGEFQHGLTNVIIDPKETGVSAFKHNTDEIKRLQEKEKQWLTEKHQIELQLRSNESALASAKEEQAAASKALLNVDRQLSAEEAKLATIEQQQAQAAQQGTDAIAKQEEKVSRLTAAYDKASESLSKLESRWQEKIQDYVYSKYPTQALVTAETRSEQGLKEREAMKQDAELAKMLAQSKREIDEADKNASQALRQRNAEEEKLKTLQSQSIGISQQKAQVDAQVAAKEKEIADTKKNIADASKAQGDAEKQATEVAKQRATVEGQVAEKEKQVADARTNLKNATDRLNEAESRSAKSTSKSQEKVSAAKQEAIAVEEATEAKSKKIRADKSEAMTLDQVAAALQKAKQASASAVQGTEEEANAIKKVVEWGDRLKSVALGRAQVNEQAFAFDAKRTISDIDAVDARLKQLNKWYGGMEKKPQIIPQEYGFEVNRLSRELEGLKTRLSTIQGEASSLGQKMQTESNAFIAARDRIVMVKDALRAYRGEIQAVEYKQKAHPQDVDVIDKWSYDQAKVKVKELTEELKRLWAERHNIPVPSQNDLAQYNAMREQIAQLKNDIERYKSQLEGITNAERQNTQEASKYTDEIRKRAAAIRESQEWKNSGIGAFGKFVDEEGVKRFVSYPIYASSTLSVEEQILQIERHITEQQKEKERLAGVEKRDAEERLQTERQITATVKSRADKYKSPELGGGDAYRKMIANATGLRLDQVRLSGTAISELGEKISTLEAAYSNLTATQRRSPFGKALREDLQSATRELQNARKELSRPLNLASITKLPERTIDDIAEKMLLLSSYRGSLNVITQKEEIEQVGRLYSNLQGKMDNLMQKNQQMIASNTALGRSWNYMKNRLAFYFTVGASTQFVKQLIDIRSQYEMTERSLGILIGSAEYGTKIFNELSQMSLVSPYTLIELSSAAKQLTAYGIAANEVVDTTRRMADVAAAVGVPMERLTYALGQVKAYGYLNSRDARMFANAGIPLVQDLARAYSDLEGRIVSVADVYDRIKKKAVSYNDVMYAVQKMTDEGGRYFDYQAKMADTLKVRLANFTLAWNNFLNDVGKSNQGVLVSGINAMTSFLRHWKELERRLQAIALLVGVVKARQYALNLVLGSSVTTMSKQILADKKLEAARLQRAAMTRKLTTEELRIVRTSNQITAADYRQMISTRALSAEKAKLMVALRLGNKEFLRALIQTKTLTAAEIRALRGTKGLQLAFGALGTAAKGLWITLKTMWASFWPLLVIGGIMEIINRIRDARAEVNEFNDALRESGKNKFGEIEDFLKRYMEQYKQLNKVITEEVNGKKVSSLGTLNSEDAKNLWEEMREQFTLTSSASEQFISKLENIDDINVRLRTGFSWLEDVQKASAVMQKINVKEDIKGFDDIKDYSKEVGKAYKNLSTSLAAVIDKYGDLKTAAEDYKKVESTYEKYGKTEQGSFRLVDPATHEFTKYKSALAQVGETTKEAAKETKEFGKSIADLAINAGLGLAGTEELVAQYFDQIKQKGQTSNEDLMRDRIIAEQSTNAAMLEKLDERIASEQAALKKARDKEEQDFIRARIASLMQERAEWQKHLGGEKAMFEGFTTWMKTYYGSEIRRMFGDKSKTELENLDWSKGENAKWARSIAKKFADEYGIAFDKLWKYIQDTNDMSIFIKLTISTEEEESVASKLKKAYQDANDAWDDLVRLRKRRDQLEKRGATMIGTRDDDIEYQRTISEIAQREKDLADARRRGGESSREAAADRKSAAAAAREQREAETELQKAFKDELQLIDKIRSDYKKLTNAGLSRITALQTVTNRYENSIENINKVLGKNGIPLFDIRSFAGTDNPAKMLEALEAQLKAALSAKNVKDVEIKDLEVKIEDVKVENAEYAAKKIVEGLNSELNKLKEEYELAVELDANPELGDFFAEMFKIDTSTLPKSFQEMLERAQRIIDRKLLSFPQQYGTPFEPLSTDIDKWAEQVSLETGSELYKELASIQKTLRDMYKKEMLDTEKMLDDYVKKYGGYSDKIAQIEAERLTKIKQLNDVYKKEQRSSLEYIKKMNAIEQGALRERNKIAWEEFKNSEYYITMFEKLEYVSTTTLKSIRQKMLDLRESLKDLTPEQLKWITQQQEKLEKELISRNPFANLKKNVQEYIAALKGRKEAEAEFARAQQNYDTMKGIVSVGQQILEYKRRGVEIDDDEIKHIAELAGVQEDVVKSILKSITFRGLSVDGIEAETEEAKKLLEQLKAILDAAAEQAEKYNYAKKIFKQQGAEMLKVIGANLKSLVGLRDFLRDDLGVTLGDTFDSAIEGLNAVGDGVNSIISSLEHADFVGALVGVGKTVYGFYDTFASLFGGGSAREKRISKSIENSQRQVKLLENAYKDLEYAAKQAYGVAAEGAKYAMVQNKKLQLAELERQLQLEKSRKKKKQDKDAIISLEGQIKDLRYEIKSAIDDIANDMLGISSVGDAAEQLVSSMIEAFKNGEDYMKVYEDSFEDMVDNMIMKAIVSKVIGQRLQQIFDSIEQRKVLQANEATAAGSPYTYSTEISRVQRWIEEAERKGDEARAQYFREYLRKLQDEYNKMLAMSPADIEELAEQWRSGEADVKEIFEEYMKAFGITYGQSSENNLSALQQGIQGVTEDTASAIEAYMNGISQQVYYQSDVLTQIRDTVQSFDMDIQIANMSQILLQLRSSYEVQMSIHSLLEGWSNPSGNSVRVEII